MFTIQVSESADITKKCHSVIVMIFVNDKMQSLFLYKEWLETSKELHI